MPVCSTTGVEMVAMPLCSSCCISSTDRRQLDPCASEESTARATLTLAVLSSTDGILACKVRTAEATAVGACIARRWRSVKLLAETLLLGIRACYGGFD